MCLKIPFLPIELLAFTTPAGHNAVTKGIDLSPDFITFQRSLAEHPSHGGRDTKSAGSGAIGSIDQSYGERVGT